MPKVKKQSMKELNLFLKSYKGLKDIHFNIFQQLIDYLGETPKKVFYPGCHRHITASLVFPDVIYLDSYKNVGTCFNDPSILEFVKENKIYKTETKIHFECKDFNETMKEKIDTFDLIISLSAGIISEPCEKYLKPNGILFVNNSHSDAFKAFLMEDKFELLSIYQNDKFITDQDSLDNCFLTTKDEKISNEKFEESLLKSTSKRTFKMKNDSNFFIFRKK
eukprot:gene8266-91_t